MVYYETILPSSKKIFYRHKKVQHFHQLENYLRLMEYLSEVDQNACVKDKQNPLFCGDI